jgi:hypothetical protein
VKFLLKSLPPDEVILPPWRVIYINDKDAVSSYSGVVPEARTQGLAVLGFPEIMIRMAPPAMASAVLDRVGVWLTTEARSVKVVGPGDEIEIDGLSIQLVGFKDYLRLAWVKDPA